MMPLQACGQADSHEPSPATPAPHEGNDPRAVAQVLALGELPDAQERGDRLLEAPPAALQQVEVRLQVSVGEVAVTIGELLAAREHQVLVLDRQVGQPVDLVLAGRVVARGQLVAVDDRFALRITELPAPAGP